MSLVPQAESDPAVGQRIRLARQSHQMSLRELARRLGVSPATVSAIETGSTRISVVRLQAVAGILEMSVADILAIDPDRSGSRERWEPRDQRAARWEPRVHTAPVNEEWADWRTYRPLAFDVVLTAALEEMLEVGYHGATVRGIAARCGLSVSGIYHYYPSKQQMLYRILELTMAELLARAEAARASGHDPVERFGNLIEHLALFHTRRRELGFIGAREMDSLASDNRRRIAQMRTTQQYMVDREVSAAVELGAFHPTDPKAASRAVVTMCTALPNWWRPTGPFAPEDIAAQYVSFGLDLMRYRSDPDDVLPSAPRTRRPA
jgi:AcrR family transcriptional regulator